MIDKFVLLIMIISPMEGAFAQSPVEDEMPIVTAEIRVLGSSGKLLAGGDRFMVVNEPCNLSGSRNLEYDKSKQIK